MINLKWLNFTNYILIVLLLIIIIFFLYLITKNIKSILKITSKITIIISIINALLSIYSSRIINTLLTRYQISFISDKLINSINKCILTSSLLYLIVGIVLFITYKIINKKQK